jgi:Spy/CpxP family protein refolding chaperone
MRNLWKVSLTLALAALVASPALAQRQRQRPGGGGGGAFGGGGMLLANKSVQEELKLTKDQKDKVDELAKKNQEMVREKLKDVPRDQIREKMAEIRKEMEGANKKAVASILKDDQQKRYKQIQVQVLGIRAFSDPDTQKALNLTDDQKTSIKEIGEGIQKKVQDETKDLQGRERFTKAREIREKLTKEAMGQIATKLTSEQKKTWKELTGDKFDYKPDQPRRPGGGAGGRPRGGDRTPPGRIDL